MIEIDVATMHNRVIQNVGGLFHGIKDSILRRKSLFTACFFRQSANGRSGQFGNPEGQKRKSISSIENPLRLRIPSRPTRNGGRRPIPQTVAGDPHYFALHIGTYVDSQGYKWGTGDQHDIGKFNAGVTYRLGEAVNSADFMIRMEYSSYSLDEGDAHKLAFIAMITFPDSNSKFPLYIGAGAGPGFFCTAAWPIRDVSRLSAGRRCPIPNVVDNLGFFVEFGMKNDFQLFSSGQFNGLFLGAGAAWTF